jgi:hypothetical protein
MQCRRSDMVLTDCFAPRVDVEGPQTIVIECADGRRCVAEDMLAYMRLDVAPPARPPAPALDLDDLDAIDSMVSSELK